MNKSFDLSYLYDQCDKKLLPTRVKDRILQILGELNKDKVEIQQLSKLCQYGLPDDIKGLRSICWKLLLQYLPCDKSKWISTTKANKESYNSFCNDFLKQRLSNEQIKQLTEVDKDPNISPEETLRMLNQKQSSVQDHPLSKKTNSGWKSFFEDQQLWDEIEKDTIRTRSELSFFVSPTQITNAFPIHFRTQITKERHVNKDFEHRHYDVLTRILFIYAKLNPAIRYVQGMNEILAPIYYAFHYDCNQIFLDSAESDAFFCFTRFMSDAKDSFMRQLDDSTDGIQGRIAVLNQLLRVTDLELWEHFESLKLNPQFYSLRWIMLYLTQEFQLFDVLRLWDSMLSKPSKTQFLYYLCLGILKVIRHKVMIDDFTDVMESLQRLNGEDIIQILTAACELFDNKDN